MKRKKVIYYRDPLNDDFAETNIATKKIEQDFPYIDNSMLYRTSAFLLYQVIVRPLTAAFIRYRYDQRFTGRKYLKRIGRQGAFIYANHTMISGDAFIPNMVCYGKKNYILAGPDAFSIRGIRTIVRMLGGIPLPSGQESYRHFRDCLKTRMSEGCTVTIYPGAHIWPYYTGIRPFPASSFRYPVELEVPVFTLTNTFQKRRLSLRTLPRVTTFVDGPFYPDTTLPKHAAMQKLRDEAYRTMLERSRVSDYEYVRYVKDDTDSGPGSV